MNYANTCIDIEVLFYKWTMPMHLLILKSLFYKWTMPIHVLILKSLFYINELCQYMYWYWSLVNFVIIINHTFLINAIWIAIIGVITPQMCYHQCRCNTTICKFWFDSYNDKLFHDNPVWRYVVYFEQYITLNNYSQF